MVVENWNKISLDGVKGILWDLDNTIYIYESVHKIAYQETRNTALDFEISESQFDAYWKKSRDIVHNQLHGQGASHSRLLYLQKLHEFAKGFTSSEFGLKLEEVYWSTFLNSMKVREGALELMNNARLNGIEMAIVTDLTAQIQLRKLEKLSLNQYVRYMVSSEEAGVEKPEPAIFQLALDKLNLKPSEVIMIGDSYEKDIKGAESIGIKAYQIDDNTI
jgi:putative hydrolase of the HAD superfamily